MFWIISEIWYLFKVFNYDDEYLYLPIFFLVNIKTKFTTKQFNSKIILLLHNSSYFEQMNCSNYGINFVCFVCCEQNNFAKDAERLNTERWRFKSSPFTKVSTNKKSSKPIGLRSAIFHVSWRKYFAVMIIFFHHFFNTRAHKIWELYLVLMTLYCVLNRAWPTCSSSSSSSSSSGPFDVFYVCCSSSNQQNGEKFHPPFFGVQTSYWSSFCNIFYRTK